MRRKVRKLVLLKETVMNLDRVVGGKLAPPSTPLTACASSPGMACNTGAPCQNGCSGACGGGGGGTGDNTGVVECLLTGTEV
jgi:hypothetical protein